MKKNYNYYFHQAQPDGGYPKPLNRAWAANQVSKDRAKRETSWQIAAIVVTAIILVAIIMMAIFI